MVKIKKQLFLCILLGIFQCSPFFWVLQVCRDRRRDRCFESYSEDHNIAQAMVEIIPDLQGDLPVNFPFINGSYNQIYKWFINRISRNSSELHRMLDNNE